MGQKIVSCFSNHIMQMTPLFNIINVDLESSIQITEVVEVVEAMHSVNSE
jgi:hypothetical protein